MPTLRSCWALIPTSALYLLMPAFAMAQRPGDGAANALGCAACGGVIAIPIIFFVLNIIQLIWVARDFKARGMDNSVYGWRWSSLPSFIGLIIYLNARPKGELVKCASCQNMRMQVSARCPTCGMRKWAKRPEIGRTSGTPFRVCGFGVGWC